MWQFPMVPITEIGYEHISSWFLAEYGIEIELSDNITNIKHVFSHLIWKVDVFMAKTEDDFAETERAKFVPKQYLEEDRKSTRLNSSHVAISYAVFCLKNKTD